MSDAAGRSPDSVERLPESADQLPEPAEEQPDRAASPPAPPGAQDQSFFGTGELSGGTAAAVARGVMPPDEPAGGGRPDPRSGPETMPSGAEPGDAERP